MHESLLSPPDVLNVPAGHCVHEDAAGLSVYCPEEHAVHAAAPPGAKNASGHGCATLPPPAHW